MNPWLSDPWQIRSSKRQLLRYISTSCMKNQIFITELLANGKLPIITRCIMLNDRSFFFFQKEHNYKFITPCGLPTLYRGINMCLQAGIPLNLQTSGRLIQIPEASSWTDLFWLIHSDLVRKSWVHNPCWSCDPWKWQLKAAAAFVEEWDEDSSASSVALFIQVNPFTEPCRTPINSVLRNKSWGSKS